METSKTVKITITLSSEEIKALQCARNIIKEMQVKAENAYSVENAEEVGLAGATRHNLEDLYSAIEDVINISR